MVDYRASDFDPPLSDDAVILLGFVQEKKRKLMRLRAEVAALALAGFCAGLYIGLHVAWFVERHPY